MSLGDLSISEILAFFTYRSFPITLNVLLLFSWVYFFIIYLIDRKYTQYLYIACATVVLFIKESLLFLTVRNIVFDPTTEQAKIDFVDWCVLEAGATFLSVFFLARVYRTLPFNNKFDYPAPKSLKNFKIWMLTSTVVLIALIVSVYLVEARTSYTISFVLPIFAISQLWYLIVTSNRIRINYAAFGNGWLNRHVQFACLGYLGLTVLVYVFFTGTGVFVLVDAIVNNAALEQKLAAVPENYFHVFKTITYIVYTTFVFLVLAKNYQLASIAKKTQKYLAQEINALGAKMRKQVLRYDDPNIIIRNMLKEISAYTQAEFAFFCFYNQEAPSKLDYIDYVSSTSDYKNITAKIDLSAFLKNIVDRKRAIIIDELDEVSDYVRDYYSFLETERQSDVINIEDEKVFPVEVSSLLSVPVYNTSGHLLYTLILINKKEDYFDEWKEETSYYLLETVAYEIQFIITYLLNHKEFLVARDKVFSTKMGIEQSTVIHKASESIQDQFAPWNKFSFAIEAAYKHLPSRTVYSTAYLQKKNPIMMIADVSGDTAARSYIAGMLHASFHQSLNYETKLSSLMKRINKTLALSQRKNFVNAAFYTYDKNRRKLCFSNAAHTSLLVFHHASQELISYDLEDPPLSLNNDIAYREALTDINEGDIIIAHSDELSNIKNEIGERYFDSFKISNIIKSIEELDPDLIAARLAAECEDMEIPVTCQIVFLVARVGMD
ncbi:hypothetical protein COTS27_01677 [Spirochaetota bacterium]|nr:hypothetical protein COTS27_01677 [Spirochaetota bacterium]